MSLLTTVLAACLPSTTAGEADVLEDVFHEVAGATPLIHASRWEAVPPEADPVRDPALDVADLCPPEAITLETTDDGLYLDIDTTDCDWYTAQQTTLSGLAAGDTLRVWAFRWANLAADGVGRFVVAAGEPPVTLWEIFPELPDDRAALYYDDVTVDQDVPEGSTVYWHIANHGQNVWSLIQLLRVDGE